MIDLGVEGFSPLRFVADNPEAWSALLDRLHRKAFLRGEGTVVKLGAPQAASAETVATYGEVARRFDRFYAVAAAAYYDQPTLRDEFLVNPMFDPLFEIEQRLTDGRSVTSMARFDCVLTPEGALRVIENNSVGVNVMHTRALVYLALAVERAGFAEGARELMTLGRGVVDGFDRGYRLRSPDPKPRPVVGMVHPPGFFRVTRRIYREMFARHDREFVFGSPHDLSVGERGMTLAGQPIDIVWPDFLFYMAYQEVRYSQTKFPSKLGDVGPIPTLATALINNRHFIENLRSGRVVMLSPAASYLALPKSLLSWIHDEERPVPAGDRAWLAEHVARTYAVRDRQRGAITLERVLDERERLLIKPCQYGGSHGVLLGTLASADEWEKGVRAMWDDPTWIVQDYYPPAKTSTGQYLTVGISDMGGELGGIYLRAEPTPLINARTSSFIPVTVSAP